MSRFGWWVALGLANLANALDPELIVLGGGLIAAGDVLIEPTRAGLRGAGRGAAGARRHGPDRAGRPRLLGRRHRRPACWRAGAGNRSGRSEPVR